MDNSYAEIGTWVILGRHKREDPWFGFSWHPHMERYVGKKTRIKNVFVVGDMVWCYVACDRGQFSWRAEDMILASDIPLLTPEQKAQLRIK